MVQGHPTALRFAPLQGARSGGAGGRGPAALRALIPGQGGGVRFVPHRCRLRL